MCIRDRVCGITTSVSYDLTLADCYVINTKTLNWPIHSLVQVT